MLRAIWLKYAKHCCRMDRADLTREPHVGESTYGCKAFEFCGARWVDQFQPFLNNNTTGRAASTSPTKGRMWHAVGTRHL